MTISKISYQKTIPTGAYMNEKIGVEVDINPGESATKAMALAKEFVEFHQSQIEEYRGSTERIIPEGDMPIIQVKKTATEEIIDSIRSCIELKVLESYRLIASRNPEIQEVYTERLEQLQLPQALQ